MESTLEVIGYSLIFHPVHAIAVAVFLYHAVAALVRERRKERPFEDRASARGKSYIDPRGFAA